MLSEKAEPRCWAILIFWPLTIFKTKVKQKPRATVCEEEGMR